MKVSDILTTTAHKEILSMGAPPKTYYRSVLTGTTEELATAPTRKEAEEGALRFLREALENRSKRAYFPSPSGRVILVVYHDGNWGYDIIRDGKRSSGSCSLGDSFEQCCKHARSHAAQYDD